MVVATDLWSQLETSLQDGARAAVRDIEAHLVSLENGPSAAHFGTGWLGGALLVERELLEIEPTPERRERVGRWIDALLESAGRTAAPGLYRGLAGTGWVLASAAQGLGTELNLEELDEHLLELTGPAWRGHYDVIGGLAGIGLYGVERAEQGARAGRELVEEILRRLQKSAFAMVGGVAWHTEARFLPPHELKNHPAGYTNLGVAHGQPGVMLFLAAAAQAGIGTDTALDLLEQSTEWVLRHFVTSSDQPTLRTTFEDHGDRANPRMAWCYNELGATYAVLRAGHVLRRSDWVQFARDGFEAMARGVPDQPWVRDCALCHGAAGNLHLFALAAEEFDEPNCREASQAYLRVLLDKRQPGEGAGGYFYPRQNGDGPEWFDPEAGFLEGSSGIALALLNLMAPPVTRWDRLLGLR